MEIGTACGSKCCSEAADAMASNEDSVKQERLRKRNQRDRLRRETETAVERDARSINWAITC